MASGLEAEQIPGIVRIAAWERYPWLRAGFSTRLGGDTAAYSGGGPGELNLGWTPEDDPKTVAENRRRFLAEVVAESANREIELVTMRQFHSGVILRVHRGGTALATPDGKAILHADGLVANERGLMLGVQTADCVPVLLADTRTRAVAVFHAGWRGTLARIVERGVATMQLEFESRPEDLIAAIGPAIRQCCFAVGEDVRSPFERDVVYAPELFAERAAEQQGARPQLYMDLHEANRRQLLDAGLPAEAISVVQECTSCSRTKDGRRKYFSHRAESGFTGRMLSVIGAI